MCCVGLPTTGKCLRTFETKIIGYPHTTTKDLCGRHSPDTKRLYFSPVISFLSLFLCRDGKVRIKFGVRTLVLGFQGLPNYSFNDLVV